MILGVEVVLTHKVQETLEPHLIFIPSNFGAGFKSRPVLDLLFYSLATARWRIATVQLRITDRRSALFAIN